MELIDAHCHFDFPCFDGARDSELERARSLGMTRLVIPGVRHADWDRVRDTALAHPDVYYCLGIHPWFVAEHEQDDLAALKNRLSSRSHRCIGVGECGLDRLHGSLDDQWPWFEAQVDMASELDLPLVIHSVRTHDEVHGLLRRRQWAGRALIHGFAGSAQQAEKLVDLGCFIGVGGVITYDRAKKTRDAIARLPKESLVLETDAPDMPPAGVAKGRNTPRYLPRVLDALAELRGEDKAELARALVNNVSRLYGWSSDSVGE